ncbi:ABC transporter ATP-binding protein [Youngiibacter multivorans]|uniref:ABC-type nitrate/sulfonate/bicarbonate transport system ATPase subunit n=1 Tax=Youngiibacter multivorans TaxID=937251 RepID=A0ABS4G045_9CLOT|nr:ATP-binding cassette domain-containing protein [Youngiibacter multivorans]MBP1917918.1 ABC-type nitrate/sulfonate/bicarbonate transport system ATPase subunit [Youngiibacter multivorans]
MKLIEVKGLKKSFGSEYLLKDFSLDIGEGEIVAVMGPSGIGKSTLLNIIGGLDKEYEGSISYDPRIFDGIDVPFPFVFQESESLLPWKTVEDNVRIAGRRLTQDEIDDALKSVGLYEHRHKKPGELSGGMKQRVSLARALVCRSRVLLLDEPFASLDSEMRTRLQLLVKDLCKSKGITVIMVTHDIAEAEAMADRIVSI